jgi:pectin methylesterase-like acyl-CoA thioesterase
MVNLKACLINGGASMVPLLVMAALNGAQPAHAAESNATGAHKIVVGNTPTCRDATFTTIQAAITAAPATDGTISVCAGTYAGKVLVTSKTNLKLVAQKGATIVPEGDAFSGDLVEVASSTNVVRGFTIDGRGR